MSLGHCENVKGVNLREFDLVLNQEHYASTGGIIGVCLFEDSQLRQYSLGWCSLENEGWQKTVKDAQSGLFIQPENYYIKVGRLMYKWILEV